MNRRTFLKGVAAAFVVPEVIVPERRVWALDKTMIRPKPFLFSDLRQYFDFDTGEPYAHDVCTFDPHITIGDYTDEQLQRLAEGRVWKPEGEFTFTMQEPDGGFAKIHQPEVAYHPDMIFAEDVETRWSEFEKALRQEQERVRRKLHDALWFGQEGR